MYPPLMLFASRWYLLYLLHFSLLLYAVPTHGSLSNTYVNSVVLSLDCGFKSHPVHFITLGNYSIKSSSFLVVVGQKPYNGCPGEHKYYKMRLRPMGREAKMTTTILHIEYSVPDFDGWKKTFDSDPLGREKSGVHATTRSYDQSTIQNMS
jgi:hypothetical protein